MTRDQLFGMAQGAAYSFRAETRAKYTAAIAYVDSLDDGGPALVLGAQVPDPEALRDLLAAALHGLDGGSATVIDLRTKGGKQ